MNRNDIREHMMVHARGEGSMMGAPGVHVGTVDRVEGDFIKLTRNGGAGEHHYVPISWVDHIDDRAVYLNRTAEEFHENAMTSPGADDAAADAGRMSANGAPGGALGSVGASSTGDNSLGDVSTMGGNAQDASTLGAGGLSGTMNPSSGQGTAHQATSGASLQAGGGGAIGDLSGGTSGSGPSSVSSESGQDASDTRGGMDNGFQTSSTSAGGSIMSDGEIGVTGSASPMGGSVGLGADGSGHAGVLGGDVGNRDTTDAYTVPVATGNTSADQSLLSGAGGDGARWGDRNSATGASGNVSSEDGLPGQGRDQTGGSFLDTQGSAQGVTGLEGYDTSYSGGSSAMPAANGAQSDGATTQGGMLDSSLAGSDMDRSMMGRPVQESEDDADNDTQNRGGIH